MKKKILNQSTAREYSKGGLYISISGTAGVIGVSKDLGDKLKLAKLGVNFVQDEDHPIDWYLQASNDINAFRVRSDDKAPYYYTVQSSHVCRQILDSCSLEKKTHRFIVSGEPVEGDLYPIITKSAKAFGRNGHDKNPPPPAKQQPAFKN